MVKTFDVRKKIIDKLFANAKRISKNFGTFNDAVCIHI